MQNNSSNTNKQRANYSNVSLVISNLNGKEDLHNCLKSLMNLKYNGTYEVIVVDAGSTDGAPEIVELKFPDEKLIKAESVGIGEAINIGIREANGELIGFDLNNDEVFSKDWLRILVNVLLSNERIGVVEAIRDPKESEKS